MKIVKKHVRYWGDSNLDGGGAENMTDGQICQKLKISSHYGGIGRLFIDTPFIRRKGKYVIITQIWGIDC